MKPSLDTKLSSTGRELGSEGSIRSEDIQDGIHDLVSCCGVLLEDLRLTTF